MQRSVQNGGHFASCVYEEGPVVQRKNKGYVSTYLDVYQSFYLVKL